MMQYGHEIGRPETSHTRVVTPLSVSTLRVVPGRARVAYLRFVGTSLLILSTESLHFRDTNGEPAPEFDLVFGSI